MYGYSLHEELVALGVGILLGAEEGENECMATKADLMQWILQALGDSGGHAELIDVSKHVWLNHSEELSGSGDLFYTWQYDLRWAAQKLRDAGQLQPSAGRRPHAEWVLAQ